MTVADIIQVLDKLAPPSYQESYDNAGLIVGSPSLQCSGIFVRSTLQKKLFAEAISKKCNLIVAHLILSSLMALKKSMAKIM